METLSFPSLSERVQSTFIDSLFIVGAAFIFAMILDRYEVEADKLRMILIIVLLCYEPVCESFGASIGQYMKGIRVRQSKDPSKRINILAALLRFVLKIFLGWISFLTLQTDPKRRAIHDLAAGSVVINKLSIAKP